MSTPAGIAHETAARLLSIAPAELEKLVKAGVIHRNAANSYPAALIVPQYVEHIRARVETDSRRHPTQQESAEHLDVSDRTIRELETKLPLRADYSLAEIRVAYLRHLREVAAGRSSSGELELAAERARLAKEQADRVGLQNAVTRNELAPVGAIEQILALAGSRVAGILDAIPGAIKRRYPSLPADAITLIATEIVRARNIAAAIALSDLTDEPADE